MNFPYLMIGCLILAYRRGGTKERFNPMTGARYMDGYDHDTLDELALVNEFSGNKLQLNRTKKIHVNANKDTSSTDNNGGPNRQQNTRRGKGGKWAPYPSSNPNKNNATQPVAGGSKDK